jgi:small subunit ribosomal protein S16
LTLLVKTDKISLWISSLREERTNPSNMLTIRMQRTGRKGHAQYRIVVQDVRQAPKSGRVVASLGHYNPHSKEIKVDIKKAELYLNNGAKPSDRTAMLLKKEGVKLPKWVVLPDNKKQKSIKHVEKLRKNRPAEPKAEVKEEAPVVDEAEPKETADEVKEEASAEQGSAETKEDSPAPEEKNSEDVEVIETPETPPEEPTK